MFQLRFNQVFVGLMALSFLSAFILPQKYSDRVRNIQGLFAPVARPSAAIGSWFRGHVFPDQPSDDHRRDADIRAQNDELKVKLANVEAQLEALHRQSQERESVGPVGKYSVPCSVIGVGSDVIVRQSLSIEATSRSGIRERMPVVYPGGFVGRVSRVGAGGAQVMLLTDPGFKALGYFFHEGGPLRTKTPPLIEGAGRGTMIVRNLEYNEAKSLLHVGDWAMLDDGEFPQVVTGERLGRIISIKPRSNAPLMAEIRLEPMRNLLELREVVVVTKE